MNALERGLHRLWGGTGGWGDVPLAAVTAPLAVLFATAVRARNLLYDRGALPVRRVGAPIVSVGNLAVGGTGKTPVAAWAARTLRGAGLRPAILVRGYGEDEVLLHRGWNPEVPLVVARDRVDGARRAIEGGADTLVLDDGFQHRRLHRDLDLVLLSPSHPLPARLLPRGPFREPVRSVRRAHLVLITAKGSGDVAAARSLAEAIRRVPGAPPVEVFPLRAGAWTDLAGASAPPGAGPPLLVTSIADPTGFARLVTETVGPPAGHLRYRDHHSFGQDDARWIRAGAGSGWVATTEKDAVKLAPHRELLPEVRVLPLVPAPEPTLGEWLVQAVRSIHSAAGTSS